MSAALKLIGEPKIGQRIWTTDKRLDQSRALRARKIWLKSTGPRTPEGKAKSSMNACKEGYDQRQILRAVRQQKKRVTHYVRLHRLFLDIFTAHRAHWGILTAQGQNAIVQELRILQNELSALYLAILKNNPSEENIIPFTGRPPS